LGFVLVRILYGAFTTAVSGLLPTYRYLEPDCYFIACMSILSATLTLPVTLASF